jgi:Tol biopolymer transport system component
VPRQIAPSGSNPSWSPDGRRVAFQSDEHADVTPSAFGAQSGSTIWTVSPEGGELREMTRGRPEGGHAAPVWSNGGRHLAFTVFEAGPDNGVWVLSLESGTVTPMAAGPGLYEAVFAPDDSALYVAGGEPLIARIPLHAATVTAAGARQAIPIPGVTGVRGLTMSRDGRRLGFAAPALSSHIWAQPVNADGSPRGPAVALTRDTSRRNSLPAVSPDGTKVAYISTRAGGTPNVWVMDIDGANGIQVTSDDTGEFEPKWFPDGKRIAYISNRGEKKGIWAVDIATRREELWLDAVQAYNSGSGSLPGRMAEFDLSPSATRAAFAMLGPAGERRVIFIATLHPFAGRPLTDGTHSVGYPAWSPDERRLAVEVKDGSSTHAGVIDVASGTLRMLTNERGQTWVRSWSPDGRKLAIAALRDGRWSLQWLNVDGSGQGIMTAPSPPNVYLRYPEWSPRGQTVVFERGELRGNIWLLELARGGK